MRFSAVALLSALAALAAAQNPFTRSEYDNFEAGFPEEITWDPTSEGTVTIVLVHGDPQALERVEVIASGIPNSGAITWTPSTTLPKGDDYALQIIDDENPDVKPNYTPQFSIESDVLPSTSVTSVETSTFVTETTDTSTETSTNVEETTTESDATTTSSATETDETSSAEETTSERSSSARTSAPAPSTTTEEAGAAPTGVKVAAGMVGFVGAAVFLL